MHGIWSAACPLSYIDLQDDVAGCFEYYAELAEKQDKQLETPVELPMAEFKSVIRHEPLGPVALISSFNYPALIATVSPESHAFSCMSPSETLATLKIRLMLALRFQLSVDKVGVCPCSGRLHPPWLR